MRLAEALRETRSARERAMQVVAGAVMGRSPDIFAVHMHRPDLFGGPYGETVQSALRGDSAWSLGERETFAATISRAHACEFCTKGHTTFAKDALAREGASYSPETLEGAPPAMRAARDLLLAIAWDAPLEKPIEALRAAGASDADVEDVIDVAASFTIINRIADALRFEVPDEGGWRRMTPLIRRMGYRAPGWSPPPRAAATPGGGT